MNKKLLLLPLAVFALVALFGLTNASAYHYGDSYSYKSYSHGNDYSYYESNGPYGRTVRVKEIQRPHYGYYDYNGRHIYNHYTNYRPRYHNTGYGYYSGYHYPSYHSTHNYWHNGYRKPYKVTSYTYRTHY